MGASNIGDRLPGVVLFVYYEDGMPNVSRFVQIHDVQKAWRTAVENTLDQVFRWLDIRKKFSLVASHGEAELVSGQRHASRPAVALVDRTRPTDHLVDPKIAAVSKIQFRCRVTAGSQILFPGTVFLRRTWGMVFRRDVYVITAAPHENLDRIGDLIRPDFE